MNNVYSLFFYKHTSATSPSDVRIFVTVISFFVNVPVLSEHITVTQPRNMYANYEN